MSVTEPFSRSHDCSLFCETCRAHRHEQDALHAEHRAEHRHEFECPCDLCMAHRELTSYSTFLVFLLALILFIGYGLWKGVTWLLG